MVQIIEDEVSLTAIYLLPPYLQAGLKHWHGRILMHTNIHRCMCVVHAMGPQGPWKLKICEYSISITIKYHNDNPATLYDRICLRTNPLNDTVIGPMRPMQNYGSNLTETCGKKYTISLWLVDNAVQHNLFECSVFVEVYCLPHKMVHRACGTKYTQNSSTPLMALNPKTSVCQFPYEPSKHAGREILYLGNPRMAVHFSIAQRAHVKPWTKLQWYHYQWINIKEH